tara:strand:+ start:2114 stop:2998 length:885 start_codon:yes stop_codon:yes gene_type:complete
MLVINFNYKFYLIVFFICFIFNKNVLAKTNYYECPEKINKVTISDNFSYKKGDNIGLSFIKIEEKNNKKFVTINFKYIEKKKTKEILKNQKARKTPVGFVLTNNISRTDLNSETIYTFVNIDSTYAFTKKNFYWSRDKNNNLLTKYEYTASSRCTKINQNKYAQALDNKKIAKKKNISKKKIIKKANKNKPSKLSGERIFALSWKGYEDLILGSLSFDEENLVGKIEFDLPKNHGSCLGTYALSTTKGTWSILCNYKNMNASGNLIWNNKTGEISAEGKDEKNMKVKFKIRKKD